MSELKEKFNSVVINLINKKIEEIENYSIDTQENEERYIHEINCLIETKHLLLNKLEKKC
tara:strand:+ start:466 stop:645 length:180 start_codon:yes stop_codon:yes gene_type:complete